MAWFRVSTGPRFRRAIARKLSLYLDLAGSTACGEEEEAVNHITAITSKAQEDISWAPPSHRLDRIERETTLV